MTGAIVVPGFTLLVPPGWVTIPLAQDAARRRAVAAVTRSWPRGPGQPDALRSRARHELDALTAQAAAGGGVFLALWCQELDGFPYAATLVVAGAPVPAAGGPRAVAESLAEALVLEGVAATVVDLTAGPAVRSRRTTRIPVADEPPGADPRRARPPAAGPSGARPRGGRPGGRRGATELGPLPLDSAAHLSSTVVEYCVPVPVPPVRPVGRPPAAEPSALASLNVETPRRSAPPAGSLSCPAVLVLTFATPVEVIGESFVGLFDAIASTLEWDQ